MRVIPLLAALVSTTALAAPTPQPVPVSSLVSQVDIPHTDFTLANGLHVIVHTDRKAPIVGLQVWYHVGSKDEPAGKTGFAHLFEHLMFNGSEHAPGDYFEPLQEIGGTDMNGTTWFDRTNYYETVPTAALERALFLESDRMGFLLGAMDQKKLDNQRGVVQNEKRQNDNEPYGLVEYTQIAALFPAGHPYGHTTIGSMADLDKASLDDVKAWFRSKYGPNNATLVLAGDIDATTARPLVEKWFGGIPRGPEVTPAAAEVPTLSAPKSETLHDRVALVRLSRNWVVPGYKDPDLVPLDVASSVLGGLSSSRLDNALVRKEKLAVGVTASIQPFERVSLFEVTVNVRPGVDPVVVNKRLDEIIADLLARGPTPDEVQRVATREAAEQINQLESIGGGEGKAATLAEGAVFAGDPDFYKKQLAEYAAVTPAQVQAVTRKWLSRPTYSLTVVPGERSPYEEAKAGSNGSPPQHHPAYYRDPRKPFVPSEAEGPSTAQPCLDCARHERSEAKVAAGSGRAAAPARSTMPAVGPIGDLRFPEVKHAKLSNGVDVAYVQRTTVPVTRVSLSFDAGNAADPKDKLGVQSLMLALLDEGTKRRNSIEIAEDTERLGATISAGPSMDRTVVGMAALTPNLDASLDLLSDIVRNPAFDPAEVERLRAQQLARISAEMTQPQGIALRTLPPLLYGKAHPYGVPFSGTGDPAVVKTVMRDDLIAFHDKWLRPDNMRIFVVSSAPIKTVVAALDTYFGNWTEAGTKGTKDFSAPVPKPAGRIVLVDRPGSPQSLILGGELLPLKGKQEIIDLISANQILGGDFLSRLNTDLRETRGWAYGVSGSMSRVAEQMPYMVYAPVQTNQTGPSIAAIIGDMKKFLTTDGITKAELDRTITGNIRELPGTFETSGDLIGAMQRNALYGRPDNYYDTLADRYRGQTASALDKAARSAIDPDKLLWVVVGDARQVAPQLDALHLPVEKLDLTK
jgi:predicted Zn-dependent peptidase